MNRGDVAIVAQRGIYEGKPRPAVVIQASDFLENHPSILVCLISSELQQASPIHIAIEPTAANGLRAASRIAVDKIVTIRRENIGQIIGRIDEATLGKVDLGLLIFLGLA